MAHTRYSAVARSFVLACAIAGAGASTAFAQAAPAAPPPLWSGSIGAGLAVTAGNSDTSNYNLAFNVKHNPDNPHLMTAEAFYLRGTNDGTLAVNRSTFAVRDEYTLSPRALLFGQVRYLRDTFKNIDYLVAPTAGVGYKVVDLEPTKLAVDVGVGGVWERNTGFETNASGAVTAGESFSHKLSGTAAITQSINALWKTSDFGDALYSFNVGLAASITPKSTLKIELLEVYKTQPPVPTVQKQDVALVTSFVYGF
jgi:putative salt-induced outer membrane protein YdiY